MKMKGVRLKQIFLLFPLFFGSLDAQEETNYLKQLFPANSATDVNPDTHLLITFPGVPSLGTSGQIRIYDAMDNRLVDVLDLSIPPGPTMRGERAAPTTTPYEYFSGRCTNANTKPGTPSGKALPTSDKYQLTIIGGFTDAFHFYPVIIHGNVATIYPHNNLLEYNTTYYVQIDPGVFSFNNKKFSGFTGNTHWIFTTKKSPPRTGRERFVVSSDGSGDFNTVQGAIDFMPDFHPQRTTIFIRKGMYEEIVYFRNKSNITFLGEDRDSVIVCYANNEVFNPHPVNIGTNEVPGTFPSRRAACMGDNSSSIIFLNLTIKTTAKGQAEGLLLMGEKNILSNVTICGSGDALQVNGSAYLTDCSIKGDGDIILGRGPAFFHRCNITSNGGTFIWIRNTSDNHGNVFLQCKFETVGNLETEIARSPTNNGKNYPYSEAVLLKCSLAGIVPAGWGPVGGDTSNIHFWEFLSFNISDGKLADVSKRSPFSRQLSIEKDSELISKYCDPTYVLGNWTPTLAPIILSQPTAFHTAEGRTTKFSVKAAAIPEATYQWFNRGLPVIGATGATISLEGVDPDDVKAYTVNVMNEYGTVTSQPATFISNEKR
jgi:pectinesterase